VPVLSYKNVSNSWQSQARTRRNVITFPHDVIQTHIYVKGVSMDHVILWGTFVLVLFVVAFNAVKNT